MRSKVLSRSSYNCVYSFGGADMNIIVSQEQGRVPVAVMRLEGQLDGQNFQEVIGKAREVYDSGTRNILLDLDALTYISSAGLVALHTIALMFRGESTPD